MKKIMSLPISEKWTLVEIMYGSGPYAFLTFKNKDKIIHGCFELDKSKFSRDFPVQFSKNTIQRIIEEIKKLSK